MDSEIRNDEAVAPDEGRRDFLKKAGIAAGATAWAVPTVQVLRMAGAGAQVDGSVPVTLPPSTNISYIGLNVTCDGQQYTIKWEANASGTGGAWEDSPGNFPSCTLTVVGTKANGGSLGFTATVLANGGVMIGVPDNCSVDKAEAKGGQNCSPAVGPLGPGVDVAFPGF